MKTLLLCVALSFVACDSNTIKIYRHDAVKQGFERKQEKEFLSYQEANGFFALSPSDMEFILNKLSNCRTRDGLKIESEEVETYLASQEL